MSDRGGISSIIDMYRWNRSSTNHWPRTVLSEGSNRPCDIIKEKEAQPTLNWKNFFRLAVHTQLMPALESGEETLVGGQAVMEGVMMRTPHAYCVAVRKMDGSLATEEYPSNVCRKSGPSGNCPSCAASAPSARPCGWE